MNNFFTICIRRAFHFATVLSVAGGGIQMRTNKLTLWQTLLSLCIAISFFPAIAAAQEGTVAAEMEVIADEVLIREEPSTASVRRSGPITGSGSQVGDTADPKRPLMPGEMGHNFFEGVGPGVDTRIWSISYWMKMAELGLVPYSAEIPVEPAVSTFLAPVDSTDVPVTTLANTTQSENSIFINPNDSNKLLNSNNSTDWNGFSVTTAYGSSGFMSIDGSSTWSGSVLGTGGPNNGDPAAAIDLSGRYYVGHIHASGGNGIAISTNEGATWSEVLVAPNPGSLADKNHLWVDNKPSSPFQGNLYSAWTDFGGVNDSEIVLSRSINGGLTWTPRTSISTAVLAGSHNQGVNIQTGPNGEVYAVWAVYDSWPSDETALGFASSSDGGATWSPATRIITNIRGIRATTTSKNHRVNSFPVLAVDISDGPSSGNLYAVWSNYGVPGTNVGPDIDVYMIRSTNGGASWSSPIKVNGDPIAGKEHYFPWIASDPVTGELHAIFYDDRNVSSTQNEVFVASSVDAGNTWTDFKVSDVAFTPSPVPGLAVGYFGDYLGVAARDGKVYPTWTDNRTGRVLAYVSPFNSDALEAQAPCVGSGYDLQTPNFYGTQGGAGAGRAIGFQADQDFELNAVSIKGNLVSQSFDVVIYDSPDGHTAGTVLATFNGTTGGTGYGWNTIPVSYQFTAGNYYVVNWRPTAPGVWANNIDFYNDDGLPFAVGPVNILEGFEGANAENAFNFLHPHFSFCTSGGCNVAVLGSPGDPAWNDEVRSKILGTGLFAQVDIIDVASMTPTLADLQQYAAVLVYSDSPGFADPVTLGDNLADYVDAGGGVVTAVFTDASIPLLGRFDSDNYWAIAPSGQTSFPEEFLGTIHDPSHPVLAGVTVFSGGSSSFRTSTFDVAVGATRIADWTDGRPLVAVKTIGGTPRVDLGFFPPSSDSRGDFWNAGTDGALLLANALNWVKNPACGNCTLENFPDPLGSWNSRAFYLNTNAESHYVASGSNCDPDFRGNQPDGIWISDDRGCGNQVIQSPVRIDFLNNYGDNKTSFSMDHFTCVAGVTLNIYDKDGVLDVSVPAASDCWNWSHFSTPLSNGISAFEYAYTGGQVEGNTSIDNVQLCEGAVSGCTPVTTLEVVSSGPIPQGSTGDVTVTTSAALTLGSTDVVMNFDPGALQASSCSSSTLSSFIYFIDNVAGTVTTASASATSDVLGSGDTLFTCTFQNVGIPPAGTTTITLSDADGDACDDLAGPVPPIPPVSLPYTPVSGEIQGGTLGDVDCDGNLTPIDAAVVLGLFVGSVQDSDLKPPCNDPAHRLAVSDWDLSGTMNPIDASVTLAVFVGNIDPGCTPLGASYGLPCPAAPAMSQAATTMIDAAPIDAAPIKVKVGRARALPGEDVTIEVTADATMDVGSTDLVLAFKPRWLEVISVESVIDNFVSHVDAEAGQIRTASAGLGQQIAAGAPLMRVVFRVSPDAPTGKYALHLLDGDGKGSLDIAGSIHNGQMPTPIGLKAKAGFVRVTAARDKK